MSKHTRFFGAAALTNAALVELFSRLGVQLFISRFTSEFLASLGAFLEGMNIEWARRIAAGEMQAENLDNLMIGAEQTAVQNCLARLHDTDDTAYASTVAQVDRVLSFARCADSSATWLCGRTAYAKVLRYAAHELGRSASFAIQNDRETIGRVIIRQLRGLACSHRTRY